MSELEALELPRTEGNHQTISGKTECAQVSDHVPPCVPNPQLENQDKPISLAKGQPHEGQQNIPSVNPVSAMLGSANSEALKAQASHLPPLSSTFLGCPHHHWMGCKASSSSMTRAQLRSELQWRSPSLGDVICG